MQEQAVESILSGENQLLRERVGKLEQRLQQRDLQRRAMLHILVDYEGDRRRLAAQTEKQDNTRRALIHLLQDTHRTNLRLEASRKAMIHIMGDLHEATLDLQRRETELRDKQEQLVQAGKMATLGELATGVAHELNNPLNNIGLFLGNVVDQLDLGKTKLERMRHDLMAAMQQVRKATEIISHLRIFGRSAPVTREPVSINHILERALSLMHEQLRLRQIEVLLDLDRSDPLVTGNAIQLEQVFVNLLTNARDAVSEEPQKQIRISSVARVGSVEIEIADTGRGIPPGLEQRIFDPFFTTKDVGKGTGLGLSITYGIIKEHEGTISVLNQPLGQGASFRIQLPRASHAAAAQAAQA